MRLRTSLIVAGLVVTIVSFGFAFSEASAGTGPGVEAVIPQSPPTQVANDSCLFYHANEGFSVQLGSGETLSLTINPGLFDDSTHGSNGVTCVTCHSDITSVPHPTAMHYPCNYGYVPHTLSEDGDPVDVLVVTPVPLISGSVIRCRPVGILNMTDESGRDGKVLAVPNRQALLPLSPGDGDQ